MTQEIIESKIEVDETPHLIVKNIKGKIQITPSNEKTISIKAIKYINQGDSENTIVNIEKTLDGSVLAEVKFDNSELIKIRQPAKVEFFIEVPHNTSLKIDGISSTLDISGMRESIKAKTISGNIEISDCAGKLLAKTISGSIIGNSINGSAELDTISGQIKITDSDLSTINSSSISGGMKVQTVSIGEGPYKFNTISGKLVFIIPPKTGCSLRASSLSGKFKTDLNATNGTIRKNKWDIELEGGGPEIKFKSISGGLRLLTSENAKAKSPSLNSVDPINSINVLEEIENGDLSVDEAILKLN